MRTRLMIAICTTIVAGIVFCGNSALAQQKKTAIAFDCTCKDTVGSLYATAMRDLIAASPRYYLADLTNDKDSKGNSVTKWHPDAVSIDDSEADLGLGAAISVTPSLAGTYLLDQEVQVCGRDKAKSCAEKAFSRLDEEIGRLDK